MTANKFHKRFNPFGIEVGKVTESAEDLTFWQSVAPQKIIAKNPSYSLVHTYQKNLERAAVLTLGLMLAFFFGFRGWGFQTTQVETPEFEFIVEQIPPTEQLKRPPAPERPSVALPSDDEDIPEDATIAATEIDFAEIPAPPQPPRPTDKSTDIFIEYDSPPEPVGGYAQIYKNLVYPRLARKAGLEALVLVQVLVDSHGVIENVKILKDSGTKVGFEEAAMDAVREVKWKPAMQRDKPVRVAVTIPIRFKLIADISL
jgi:protein TonB